MPSLSLAALVGGGIALSSATAHALVFQFQFDGVADGPPLDPPIVGTGSFSFDGNPGTGSFALDSLANYTYNFLFNGDSAYENRDTVTPTSEVLVLISKAGNSLKLNFSNINSCGSGAYFGSIEFFNGVSTLSFEPPGYGGNLDLYQAGSYVGNYSASAPDSRSASASEAITMPIMQCSDELMGQAEEALMRSVFMWMTPIERFSFLAIRNPKSVAGRILMALAGTKNKIPFNVHGDGAGLLLGTTGLYRYNRDVNEAVWVAWFSVDPKARGRGIGQALIDHTVSRARNTGFNRIRLYTSTGPKP
jgi:hypothetical protein